MSVRFDTNAAIADMHRHLVAAMVQLQGEFLREAQAGMRTPEGADSLYEGDVTETAGVIAVEVIGGAWAAMDNFGTGSKMDLENHALEDYIQSELWNSWRNDIAIRGRPEGTYTDIFGEEQYSTGKMAGRNLEKVPRGKFAPQPPSHALETAARWMANGRMQAVIAEALASVPWGRYIIVDGR